MRRFKGKKAKLPSLSPALFNIVLEVITSQLSKQKKPKTSALEKQNRSLSGVVCAWAVQFRRTPGSDWSRAAVAIPEWLGLEVTCGFRSSQTVEAGEKVGGGNRDPTAWGERAVLFLRSRKLQ